MSFSKGFTLSEVLVSLVVVSVGLLALSTLALFAFDEFQATKSRIETENEAVKFQLLITNYFSQAVNVGTAAPPVAGNTGGILNVNFDEMADPGTDFTLMASFLRDTGGRSATNAFASVIGQYRPSAIWWRRPSATTSGVVFFYGNPTVGAPTFVATRAAYSHQYTAKMTELEFRPEFSAAGPPSAVLVRAVFRYFRPSSRRSWCPQADVVAAAPGCAVGTSFHVDLEKSFRIILRNNVLRATSLSGDPIPERPLGGVYFFNPTIPMRWSF